MTRTVRYNYVIGDVQGCFEALKALLKEIRFDPDQDFIWFAGDLVARGENSLGALRFIKKLVDNGVAGGTENHFVVAVTDQRDHVYAHGFGDVGSQPVMADGLAGGRRVGVL